MTATSSDALAVVAAEQKVYSLSSRAWSHTCLTCELNFFFLLYKDAHCFFREAGESRWVTALRRLGSEDLILFQRLF